MNLSHGYEPTGLSDPFIDMADEMVQNFSMASKTGGYLVDMFPFRTSGFVALLEKWLT